MTLQHRQIECGQFVWRNYMVDGEQVLSPVDIDKLPFGVYLFV